MPSGQGKAYKGSQHWTQVLVNEYPKLLNDVICARLPGSPTDIDWRSPVESENYKENRDREFLVKLGNSRYLNSPLPSWENLYSFWPKMGPRWDAHGVTNKSQPLLGEAKSHTAEMQGAGSGATSQRSIDKIARSLTATQQFLGVAQSVDWANSPYFQYANRLAHLYWLHALNGRDAYLVMLYFLNDTAMVKSNTIVPKTISEWKSAIAEQDSGLKIPVQHPLSDRIIHAFIDVNDIKAR